MTCNRFLVLACLLIAIVCPPSAGGETARPQGARPLVVEELNPGGAASRAGLEVGDRILGWRRAGTDHTAAASGEVVSPFALLLLAVTQAPLGELTLSVDRAGEHTDVIMPPGEWGLLVRPALAQDELDRCRFALEKIEHGHPAAGVEAMHSLAADTTAASRAFLLYRAGVALEHTGELDRAADAFARAAEHVADDPSAAALLCVLGADPLVRSSRLDEAQALHEKALDLRESVDPESLEVADSLNYLGRVAFLRGDLQTMLRHLERARGIVEARAPGSLAHAAVMHNIGTLQMNLGHLETAQDLLKRAHDIRQELIPDTTDVAKSLSNLALVADRRGDYETAEHLHLKALGIIERLAPGTPEHARRLNMLGVTLWNRGRIDLAEQRISAALAIQETTDPGSIHQAHTLNNLGVIALNRGDLATAERFSGQALEIRQHLAPDSLDVALSLNNLAVIVSDRGDYARSNELHRRALDIRKRVAPDSADVGQSLVNLGANALEAADPEMAEHYLVQALEVHRKLNPDGRDVALCLSNLGLIARNRGDLDRADQYYAEALSLRQRQAPDGLDVARYLDGLGAVHAERGDYVKAEEALERALAIRERESPGGLAAAESYSKLSKLEQLRGDDDAALEHCRLALAIHSRLAPGTAFEAESLHRLGLIHRDGGRKTLALDAFARAVEALEAQQGRLGGGERSLQQFRAKYAGYYRDYMELLLELGREHEAFDVLERSRAQAFLAMLAARDLVLTQDLAPELDRDRRIANTEYDRALAELGRLTDASDADETRAARERLARARRTQEEVRQRIRQASPRLFNLAQARHVSAEEVQSTLDDGTLLLAYALGGEQSFVFAIGPEGEALDVLPLDVTEDALALRTRRYRNAVESAPRLVMIRRQADRLGDTLFGPVERRLNRAERLIVVPDGPLHWLPWAAIVPRSDDPTGTAKPVSVNASATVFAELKALRRSRAATRVVAFGDPLYPRQGSGAADRVRSALRGTASLERLPGTRREIESMRTSFGEDLHTFLGAEATEQRARTESADATVVHFACHGCVDELFPMDSALVFAIPEDPAEHAGNGFLQAWEILESVRLDADLVTLSACQTGLGAQVAGEGMVGLTRTFQYAGARSVLASLWNVADNSTAVLMERFYHHVASGAPKDEALRLAQQELVSGSTEKQTALPQRFAHPRHWAGFQLYGDWR